MTCKKCGKRISGEPQVCPRCGAPLKETVSLGAIQAAHAKKKKKKKPLTTGQIWARVGIISGIVIVALVLLGVLARYWLLPWWMDLQRPGGGAEPDMNASDVGVNQNLPSYNEVGIRNIALFGLDDRTDTTEGRSDAIIILSIDQKHNKIKLTSIARDSLVKVDGYYSTDNMTKITHAFAFGSQKTKVKEEKGYYGAKEAIKAINQNFGMNITDYVYVNFFEFAEIIDFLGGVQLDVDASEKNTMNRKYISYIQSYGISCKPVTKTGYQLMSGGQALAYARIRSDSDLKRGDRQKEVLEAAFAQIKKLPLDKYPELLSKILGICHSNLSSNEILDMATWAVTASPAMVNYTLPDETCGAWGGTHSEYGWVWIYDMEYATKRLHAFIYDDTLGELANARPTTTNIPKKTTTTTATTTGSTSTTTTTTGGGGTTPTGSGTNTPTGSVGDPSGGGTTPTGSGTSAPSGSGTDPSGSGTDPSGGGTTPTGGETNPSTDVIAPSDSTTTTGSGPEGSTTSSTEPTSSTTAPEPTGGTEGSGNGDSDADDSTTVG